MVEKLQAAPSVPLLAPAPQQYLLFGLTNGHSSVMTETVVAAPEGPAVPAGETIDSLVRPLVESANTGAQDKAVPAQEQAAPTKVAPRIEGGKLNVADPPAATESPVAEPAAFATPPVEIAKLAVPAASPAKTAPPVEFVTATAAEPPAAAPVSEPAPLPPPVVQFADVIPTAPLAKTAPPLEAAILAAAETAPEIAEPATLPAPVVKLAEFAKTPRPLQPVNWAATETPTKIAVSRSEPKPFRAAVAEFGEFAASATPLAKTAPSLESTKLFAAAGAPKVEVPRTEPTPFRARGVQIGDLPATSAPIAKTAARVEHRNLPAAELRAVVSPPLVRSAAFVAPVVQLPKLIPTSEPLIPVETGKLSEALGLQAESVLDAIELQIKAYESEIRAIVTSFQAQPKISLLDAPREIVAAPAPADTQWIKAPRPAIPTSRPADTKCASLAAPPQKPPLAGPFLPPELRNFIEEATAAPARVKSRIGMPAWIISLVIATTVFLFAGNLIQYLSGSRDARAASSNAPSPGQAVASAPAAPAFEPHPFARFVEVTGLRVVADLNHRSQVQYIVVNHSSAQLSGMLIRIAVRSSSDPAGSAPLFTVSAVVPSLGPHQSKEIRTDLDSELRSSAIPDWEYLRTDVQVGTQN